MRKLSTLLCLCLFVISGQSQNCTVFGADYVNNFISCADDPGTMSISFGPPPHPSGYGTLQIIGTAPAVDLSGLTIYVPDKATLEFSGNVIIDAGTNFQGTGGISGNSEVRFGEDGTTYKNNRGVNSFFNLNQLIVSCSANPDPVECLGLLSFLPVELTAFEGTAGNDGVALHWITASELNNDYFQIEHSRDGINFFPVGKVKGEGTSTEIIEYSFMHRQPILGANYYRLKQVDYDGAFVYSDMVVVELSKRGGGIRVYPNPTVDVVIVQIADRPERINFNLSNLVGQGIDIRPRLTGAGWELDLTGLVKGIYLLRVEYDGRTVTRKIVKK